MISFLKRHIFSVGLLILSLTIGLVIYLKETPIDMWLVEYEFETAAEDKLADFMKSDTVFQRENILYRNYVGSVGDTLTEEGIRRYELKLYLPQDKQHDATEISSEVLAAPTVRVVKSRFLETQKNRQKLLYWGLFGLFLGMVTEFLISLKKKPDSH